MSFVKRKSLDNSAIASIVREHGPKLFEQAIKVLVAGAVVQEAVSSEQDGVAVEQPVKKPSLGGRIASAALVRVATTSVPGAIIVSGGLIAKALHDRHKARRAAQPAAGTFGKLRK